MKIGVNLPNFGPGCDPGVLRSWAQTLGDLGFDLLMVSDHVVITPDVAERYPAPVDEPFTTLSWPAGLATRLRLGTAVLIAPSTHPHQNGADMITSDDHTLLRRAIALAAQARAAGNPPFGSLLTGPDGTVLAEEHNTTLTDQDITAHPELKLARWAARELDAATAAGTTMYTNCRPCEMCEAVIRQAGLQRVVFALSDEQLLDIRPGSGRPPVPQVGPALLDEARAVVEGYYR